MANNKISKCLIDDWRDTLIVDIDATINDYAVNEAVLGGER